MSLLRDRLGRQVSRMEFTAAVVVIAVLITVFLTKVSGVMVDAERSAFTLQVTNLRVALMLEVTSRLSRKRGDTIAELRRSNPMYLLGDEPANYLGELDREDSASIPGGHWYFDKAEETLVYRVKHGRHFETTLRPPKRAQFVVDILFHDVDQDGDYDPDMDRVYGASLHSTDPYQWLIR